MSLLQQAAAFLLNNVIPKLVSTIFTIVTCIVFTRLVSMHSNYSCFIVSSVLRPVSCWYFASDCLLSYVSVCPSVCVVHCVLGE